MDIAFKVAEQATCTKRCVGAIIVKDRKIVASGYNGSPKKMDHCIDDGCLLDENGKCMRCIHAEVNAIIQASPAGRENATMYVTCEPCDKCQQLILNSGITRVVYKEEHKAKYDWLSQADWIETVKLGD
jgi:dCMP deaminase